MKSLLAKSPRPDALPIGRPKLQRIVAAVDFSPASLITLNYAAELAARFQASLTLVHVVEPKIGAPEAERLAAAKAELNTLGERMLGPCRVVETSVRSGIAFFEIVEAAKALGADMIVIGSHGNSERDHTALGDTADNVLRHAPGHVFVVRIPAPEFVI
ncbi:MAG: universal stress protein [Verrucomicrobiota bacterium]|jgi:nucleotide-binding universal stress UspA family protein|nr:universal stress protein [Limisphaerales bacterium]